MTHSQTNSNMHPETQTEMRLSLADYLAQADDYLRDAKRRKLAHERGGTVLPVDRAVFMADFYLSVSNCAENAFNILAARDMYARVDAGLCSMEDIGHDGETLDPETMAEAEALAEAAELILSQINSLIN